MNLEELAEQVAQDEEEHQDNLLGDITGLNEAGEEEKALNEQPNGEQP